MSELRRRQSSVQSTGEGGDGINEPLLGASGGPEGTGDEQTYSPDTPTLLEFVLLGWQAMVYYVNWFMNLSFGIPSPDKVSKFKHLRDSVKLNYNEDDPEHQVQLAALWKLCFPDEPWYCGPSDRWKDAGFQGSNPASDFRGGGIYSLKNLIYMGKHHKSTFQRLLWKKTGERSDFEYPFCAAGINLTFYVQQLLELRSATRNGSVRIPSSKVGRHFLNMLDEDDKAFEELYVASFEVLDCIWLDKRASYMEFPSVLNDTMATVKDSMLQSPRTIAELRESLGLEVVGP